MTPDAILHRSQTAFGVSQSFSGRRWHLRGGQHDAARTLARDAGLSPMLAQILAGRGVSADEIDDLFNPTLKRLLPEPNSLADMNRAVTRVAAAIDTAEKIAVFGDYDVDGSCSTAMAHAFLGAVGPMPRIYVPDRMTEGYGPSAPAMRLLKAEGVSLVLTVDCGATAIDAMDAARKAGLEVIVLDHHATDAPLSAFAHINPNRVGDMSGLNHICAAGVTFLFLVALNRHLRESGWYVRRGLAEPDLMAALDLVGLATICDVVPLTGVNRAFARTGLARLSTLQRPGIAALAHVAHAAGPFSAYHAGFVFGPRINAGGRVGKCSLGAELLSNTDATACAEIATLLDLHNRERQTIEAAILQDAVAMAQTQANMPFLLVAEEGWHPGVVGIVAGRLKDRFAKPAFVAGFEGGLGRGSARSVPGVDIGAIIRRARDAGVIESGGGHAMAAGFGLRHAQRDVFGAFLSAEFARLETSVAQAHDLELEGIVAPRAASIELVADLARLGPFGAGNPEPVLAVPDARIAFADVAGKDHVRLTLAGGDGARLNAIAFRVADRPLGQALLAARGQPVHFAGRLKSDEWNGRQRVQLQVEDAAPAGA